MGPWGKLSTEALVPNVPCGVESRLPVEVAIPGLWFLMYRVELKAVMGFSSTGFSSVFLMYRVELKVG